MQASELQAGRVPQTLVVYRRQMWAVDIDGRLIGEREYPHPVALFPCRLEAHNQARKHYGTAVEVVVTVERASE